MLSIIVFRKHKTGLLADSVYESHPRVTRLAPIVYFVYTKQLNEQYVVK